ncbi:MAG: hypothetical protein RL187_922, partial [Actinomycetota bacterium]
SARGAAAELGDWYVADDVWRGRWSPEDAVFGGPSSGKIPTALEALKKARDLPLLTLHAVNEEIAKLDVQTADMELIEGVCDAIRPNASGMLVQKTKLVLMRAYSTRAVDELYTSNLAHSAQEQEKVLYESSKALLKEAGYVGAGTCEFLIGKDGTISFLEVNTRLQVEHPVSEEITGIDLVREQFRIAEGGTLDYGDPPIHGHSIEFRINGEDAGRGFLPTPGPIHSVRFPGGPGVRVDSGITTGDVITGSFDSLLAKLIVTGATRKDAIEKARRALKEFEITGLPTVIPFHRVVVEDPAFCAEKAKDFTIHTRWIETEFTTEIEPWDGAIEDGFDEEELYRTVVVEVEGRRLKVGVPAGIFAAGQKAKLGKAPKRAVSGSVGGGSSEGTISSPMQATVVKVLVEPGHSVVAGDLICVLEAMKMEQPIIAPKDGTIDTVNVRPGDSVSGGQILAVIG